MIITRNFAFVHMHKCGGTFINDFIKRFFPDAIEVGYHLPIGQLPQGAARLPVLGTARNPWSFYVSYYAFQQQVRRRMLAAHAARSPAEQAAYFDHGIDYLNGVDVIFDFSSHGGERDFASTLEHMLSLGMLPELLDAILPRMPLMYGQRTPDAVIQREGFRGMNLLRHELATIRDTGLGFYSFMFRRMYGPPSDRVTILPMEQIREQLPSFLESAGVVVTAEMQAYLVSAEALNRSEHDDYRSYYPPRLRDMVAARDQELLSRFNYAFDPPAESYSRLQSVA